MRRLAGAIIVAVSLLAGLGGCARPEDGAPGSHDVPAYTSAGKAQAPVALRHALSLAEPQPGVPLVLTLELVPEATLDALEVSVNVTDLLELRGPRPEPYAFDGLQTPQVRLELLPLAAGTAYVNVIATASVEGRRSVRSFALPVRIGAGVQQKGSRPSDEAGTESGERVVPLPVEERVGETAPL